MKLSITLFPCVFQTHFFLCDFQVNRLQDQGSSLKTANEHLQKQNEDLINTLKEVGLIFPIFSTFMFFLIN